MFTASFVAAGAGTVGIANAGTTSGNNSILGGNQVSAPISIPVDVCGNAVAVLGHALAFCKGGASVSHGSGGGSSDTTSGNESIGGGNQVKAPVSIPVNICGNAVNGLAHCAGGASVGTTGWDSGSAGPQTSGNESILGGNQVSIPVKVPVNICGNAVAVLGGAFAACEGGAWTGAPMTSASTAHLLAARTASAARPAQAALLSASTPAAPGMGSGSLFALASGALLAGAATLIAAGRRLSVRKAGR
jgi:hypothetical protein